MHVNIPKLFNSLICCILWICVCHNPFISWHDTKQNDLQIMQVAKTAHNPFTFVYQHFSTCSRLKRKSCQVLALKSPLKQEVLLDSYSSALPYGGLSTYMSLQIKAKDHWILQKDESREVIYHSVYILISSTCYKPSIY